jgi:hypothetical protein
MKSQITFLAYLKVGMFLTLVLSGNLAAQPPAIAPATGGQTPRSLPIAAQDAPKGGPNELLQRAILNMEQLHSIAARFKYRIFLFNKELLGSGEYLEQRGEDGLQLRFELKTAVGNEISTLVQVCDGQYLWISEKAGGKSTLGRIDLDPVLRTIHENEEQFRGVENMAKWPGMGGLPKLLRGLYSSFDFSTVEEVNTGGGGTLLRLQGEWKRARLAELLPDQKNAIEKGEPFKLERLAPQIPHTVALYLSQDRLFPYRIEYHRRNASPDRGRGESQDTEIVRVELLPEDLMINAQIPPAKFVFDPPASEKPDNLTERFLESIGVKKKK